MAIYIMTVFVLIFASRKNVLVFSTPPVSGDWVVTETESYYDQIIVLNGNLIVEDGGNLTFRKVTLMMNCTYNGQFNITVKHGGSFYVLEGSVITSVNPDKRYMFSVWSTFRMNYSELHECGWNWEAGAPGLEVGDNDVIVENSLLSNNMRGINIYGYGIVIRNNIIKENGHIGIFVGYGSPIICNNYILLNNGSGVDCPTASPTICNNTITANQRGILFYDKANPIIQDNIITLNNGEGIHGSFNCSPIIQGNNIISNDGQAGIVLKANCTGIIQGNTLLNNSEGIVLYDHCNPLIQGNIIKSNRGVGVLCGKNSLPEIHWNDIYGNEQYGVANDDSSVNVNATYNYWGSESGPVQSPPDSVDPEEASQNVTYNPWLTESILSAEITKPLSSETVSSPVTVSTEIHAQNGFYKAEFYIDDKLEYTDYDMPYEWNWDTKQYTETEHKITAKAYDMLGLKISTSITVFVDNTTPTVSIKEPRLENVYYGILRVSVNATDNKELSKVHFRVDNTEWLSMTYNLTDLLWKYDLNTTTLSDGQHILMVLALDKASNPATASTTLLIDNGPPTLTIQTPQSGMTVGLTLVVNVQASDTFGISKIEFYLEDVLVYTVTGTPYQWSWDTTEYPNGEYAITIKAYDTVGHIQTSQTTVTVKNVEPQWWQTHFWTIMQVLVAIGGLILAVLTYLTRKKEKKKETDE